MALEEKLVQGVRKAQTELSEQDRLLSKAQLAGFYETFRKRFGPDSLSKLDGEALLQTIHDYSDQDSLVYWLEYKNDDELPAMFGSIAGGSALKYGIYRRKETGIWMMGAPQSQQELSIEQAIQVARKQRDQLVEGAKLLERLPANASDADYATLQKDMTRAAPDVSDSAWGHKYFSMLYPDKLDDYHNPDYQRFHLIKLLQIPPQGKGRYVAAGRYVAIASELEMPLNHLTTILNHKDGNPHRYWRVLANFPDTKGLENNWDMMQSGGYVAIPWGDLGDLSDVQHNIESKNRIRSLMETHYGDKGRWASEIFNFVAVMAEGDLVLAFEGATVLGIGRVVG
ncbi:MAG: AAA family ATPase, partial [Anaerolineae bacterium]|nr:AAA family ATPase [Anaerolineae bacterium]